MSNIHGLGEYSSQPRQGQQRSGGLAGQGDPYNAGMPQAGLSMSEPPAPGMAIPTIRKRLVPRFKYFSFTFFITMVDILMFIITMIVAGLHLCDACEGPMFDENNLMAGPSSYVLYAMGAANKAAIQDGQIWRLLTPIVLHAGLLHIASNLLFQTYFGYTFEARWGTKRFALLYLIAGLGGSLLSTATASIATVSVGASGALFGLLGVDISYLYMNWAEIPGNKQECCMIVFVIVSNFISGIAGVGSHIDNFAHLGGLLAGMFAGAAINQPLILDSTTNTKRGLGASLLFAFYLTLLCIIFIV